MKLHWYYSQELSTTGILGTWECMRLTTIFGRKYTEKGINTNKTCMINEIAYDVNIRTIGNRTTCARTKRIVVLPTSSTYRVGSIWPLFDWYIWRNATFDHAASDRQVQVLPAECRTNTLAGRFVAVVRMNRLYSHMSPIITHTYVRGNNIHVIVVRIHDDRFL